MPCDGGEFVGLAVFPKDGIGVVLLMSADAVGLRQFACATEYGHTG